MDWYQTAHRHLPWREDPIPYKVWISEIMLQQTRVDTVIPYFHRFLSELPDIQALAEVEEDKLLKLWQGLGYYSRALNLKKAAQVMVEKYSGHIPQGSKELLALPGIGPYTAGAIASIAFQQPVSAVDGNVLRIVARLTASRADIADAQTKKDTESVIETLIPQERPGDFNQALMDLGATICLPNGSPKCEICPVQEFCQAYLQNLTLEIPVKVQKKIRNTEKRTIFILHNKGRVALRKRGPKGLLRNLWEFPNVVGLLTENQCKAALEEMGFKVQGLKALGPSKHIFTHLEWHMRGFSVEVEEDMEAGAKLPETEGGGTDFVWATKEEIFHQYSIPTAFKAYMPAI